MAKSKMRRRILAAVGAVVLISLLSSTFSLLRITEVNLAFSSISRVISPLERLTSQMESDSDLLKREMERGLGYANWKDPHWRPRRLPSWLIDALDRQIERGHDLVSLPAEWASNRQLQEFQPKWVQWHERVARGWQSLKTEADQLYRALMAADRENAQRIYPAWVLAVDVWQQELDWGTREAERLLRSKFTQAQENVTDLKTSLQIVFTVVVFLSFLLLWLGEKALRPLAELTRLARSIRERGLRQDDKTQFPEVPLSRQDEVSQLAREFRRMAVSLLEREKTVESQKSRLETQNRLLREMGELEKRLQMAENLAAVGRLSAQVAHEVRNPLHSIGLETEIALEEVAKAPHLSSAVKQSLQSIQASVDRLERITENYLKLSRLSAGKHEPFAADGVLEEVLAIYAPVCESAGIRVEWSREKGARFGVLGDRGLFEQALGNLFRNAIQAVESAGQSISKSAGRIEWKLGNTETGKLWLRVSDNGPGIPDEIRSRLFSPFITTKAQGTGLGLSFVKQVVENHGGEVSATDAPEGGAQFEIRLPLHAEPAESAESEPARVPERGL